MLGFCSLLGASVYRHRSNVGGVTRIAYGRRDEAARLGALAWYRSHGGQRAAACDVIVGVARLTCSDSRKSKQSRSSDKKRPEVQSLPDEDRVEIVQVVDPREPKLEALPCFVEDAVTIEGVEYLVLSPCLQPVVFARFEDGEDESALIPIEDPVEVESLFKEAFLALAEEDLCLVRTAVVFTVDGDLSQFFDDDDDDDEEEEDDENDLKDHETATAASAVNGVDDTLLREALDDLGSAGAGVNHYELAADDDAESVSDIDDELELVTAEEEEVEVLVTFQNTDGRVYYVCAPTEPLFLIGRRSEPESSLVAVVDREEQDRVGPLIELKVQERLDRASKTSGRVSS
jgi:hypothetical protein